MSQARISPGIPLEPAESNSMGRAGVQALVALLFFVSGTCSLVYQIAWVRMLVPTFGMSVFAVSTVLTAFMAGLALGSAWFGRIVDRTGRGLRIYGWLEAGIGLFALALPLLLGWTNDLYGPLYRATGESRFLFFSLRFVLVFLVLLVPTTLMGGTLPVLSRWAVRSFSRVGWNVGRLYAVNTFGAAFGCFLAAFVLMERLGVRGTSYLAAAGNLLIALAAFTLSRFWTEADAGADPRTEPMDGAPALARTLPRYATRFVFWGFAASGFAALGYEVVWTRLLSVILRLTTTQSLSVILVVFLFGLAAGGVVGAWWVDRWRRPFLAFGVLELLLGLFGLGSIAAFGTIPGILDRLGGLASWQGHMLRLLVASFAVMLVPTFLMGVLFPVAAKIHALELKTLGRRVGGIYAINTGGAILGAFVTGFVLIPTFGTQGTIQALAAVNLALGAGALLLNPSGRMRSVATLATFTLPVVVLAFVPSSSFLVGLFSSADGEVIYYDEDTAGTVTVQEYGDGLRVLRVNGAGEVPTDRDSLRTFRLLGNLPMMLHPDPQDVLVVAFGGGITLASAEMQRPARIEVVEIVPGVVDAAPLFSAHNNEVFTRLGTDALQLIEDDGRNHLLRSDREYDVIIVDSTHPGTSDSWVLYTEEFYRLCRGRLKPGGVVAPWLPIHGLTADDYKTIVRTFRVVFPHSSIWLTPGYSVLFGSIDPLRIDYRQVASRLEDPAVRAGLEEVDLGDPASFLSSMALDSDAMFRYLEEGVINTDDKPCISLGDRLRAGTGGGLPVLLSLVPFAYQHGHGAVAGATETEVEELNRRVRARRHGFLSGVASQMGDRDRAVEQARRAVALDAREYEAQRILGTEGRRP